MISLSAIGLGMLQAALERAAQARVPLQSPPKQGSQGRPQGPGEAREGRNESVKRKAYGASREGAEEKQ